MVAILRATADDAVVILAFTHPEFKSALEHYPCTAVASPHLFTRLTVPNLCVGP